MHGRLTNAGGYRFDITTIIYIEQTVVEWHEIWKAFDDIHEISNGNDWISARDFIEVIRFLEVHEGIGTFNNVIEGLLKLDAVNGHCLHGATTSACMHHTKSKLDQVFVNHNWASRWPQMCPLLLFATSSDHATILLELFLFEKGNRTYKFYNSWLRQSSSNDLFQECLGIWCRTIERSPLFKLQFKIKCLQLLAREWA